MFGIGCEQRLHCNNQSGIYFINQLSQTYTEKPLKMEEHLPRQVLPFDVLVVQLARDFVAAFVQPIFVPCNSEAELKLQFFSQIQTLTLEEDFASWLVHLAQMEPHQHLEHLAYHLACLRPFLP